VSTTSLAHPSSTGSASKFRTVRWWWVLSFYLVGFFRVKVSWTQSPSWYGEFVEVGVIEGGNILIFNVSNRLVIRCCYCCFLRCATVMVLPLDVVVRHFGSQALCFLPHHLWFNLASF
jgi:hypothetical protein